MKTITEQGKGHTGNATATMQEASTIPHRYGQLFIKVFCLNYQSSPSLFVNYQKKKYPSTGDWSMMRHFD